MSMLNHSERLVEIARLALEAQVLLKEDSQETPTERTLRELRYGNRLVGIGRIFQELTK